ncbi:MAG: hypothetical protein AAB913_02540 [Patescibacteria group bacterium]
MEVIIPHLFLEIKIKNIINTKAITPNKIAKYKFTKIKERKSTPTIKPKQDV